MGTQAFGIVGARGARVMAGLTVGAVLASGLAAPPATAFGGALPDVVATTPTAAATVSNEALPPSTVTLSVDRPVIEAGQVATLTASVDQPLQATGSVLEIWDTTTEARLGTCASGVDCRVSTAFHAGDAHQYEARVNELVSAVVSIERKPWTVEPDPVSRTPAVR